MTVRTSVILDEIEDADITAFLDPGSPERLWLKDASRNADDDASAAAVLRELLRIGARQAHEDLMRRGYAQLNEALDPGFAAAVAARGRANTDSATGDAQ